jgi:hypothetical protein
MTLVLAVEHNGRVFMAADSIAMADYFKVPRSDSKIFANGELLIGFAGSYRYGQIIKYASIPQPSEILPKISASENLPKISGGLTADWETAEKYMVTHVVPAIKEAIVDATGRAEDEANGGIAIIAFNNYMFYIDVDFQVGVYRDNFIAVGMAEREALAVNRALGGVGNQDPTTYLTHILESIEPYTVIEGPWTYGATAKKK